ncbi:hypothetical protein C8Q74DRAFT_1250070 [Fomes fomentarius]|nr:hypothetical protein C8Q74DRAFT_1250070 [Fomes fomentarius]
MEDEHTIESCGHIQSEVDELADRVGSMQMQQSPDVSNEQQLQWAGIRYHQMPPLDQEILRISPHVLHRIKQELNMGEKELTTLILEEKAQVLSHRRRIQMNHRQTPGLGSARGVATEPSPSPTLDGSTPYLSGQQPLRHPDEAHATSQLAPSPSAILNGSTPNVSNHAPSPPPPPTSDGLDPNIDFSGAYFSDLDPNIFNRETSLDFERDFAAWFDPESTA